MKVGGVPTKHYLGDELVEFLGDAGFAAEGIEKVEFPWEVELENAPNWLRPPTPCDWMAWARPMLSPKDRRASLL